MSTRGKTGEAQALIKGALELEQISATVQRPEYSDDMREQLMDTNPPLPAALVVFAEHDAIEAHFEDESQSWGEATPEPNLILPLNAFDPESVQSAFHIAGSGVPDARGSQPADRSHARKREMDHRFGGETMEARVVIGANRNFVLKNAVASVRRWDVNVRHAPLRDDASEKRRPPSWTWTSTDYSVPEDAGRGLGSPHRGGDPARECVGPHARHDHLVDCGRGAR